MWTEINEDRYHPLYELQQEINQLDNNSYEAVESFFDSMTTPPGFYAAITSDEWGYWITFFRPIL